MTAAVDRSRSGLERWAAFSGAPNGDAAPSKVIAWYSDSGHRDRLNIGWIFIGLGLFSFLWFLTALRQALIRLVSEGFLPTLATVGGAVYATLALAAAAVSNGIRTMSDDTYHHQVFPELVHAANDAAYVLHSTGGAGIGAMMIAASLAVVRSRALPVWLGWIGVAAGIIALASIVFFPWFLIALWLLAASVILFVAGSPRRLAL